MTTTQEDGGPVIQCSNPDCKIASGGRCFEGFPDAEACPQFGKTLVIVSASSPSLPTPPALRVLLPHAEALSLSEATGLLRSGPCNVISLVGPHDSGKTSLIAGMYDLLQSGPVGGYAFAGSSTMHSFERACHNSRRESQRDVSHMERTERGEVLFFHVDLVGEDCGTKRAALLGNRAGEEYTAVRNEPDLAKGYPELGRSDVLTILVDGAKLLDAGERHEVRAEVRTTLGILFEVDVVSPWQRLALVLTKLDEIRKNEAGTAGALRYFESLLEDVRTDYAQHFADLQPFAVAASPKSTNANRGEGMALLLQYWMAEPHRDSPSPAPQTTVTAERAFGRLQPTSAGLLP